MRIFVNWRDLAEYPITCSETQGLHNGLKYGGVLQNPLDFGGMQASWPVTSDTALRCMYADCNNGNYVEYEYHENGVAQRIIFVHVKDHAKVGDVIGPGNWLCSLAPQAPSTSALSSNPCAYSAYPVHLHAARQEIINGVRTASSIRQLIFKPTPPPAPPADPCADVKKKLISCETARNSFSKQVVELKQDKTLLENSIDDLMRDNKEISAENVELRDQNKEMNKGAVEDAKKIEELENQVKKYQRLYQEALDRLKGYEQDEQEAQGIIQKAVSVLINFIRNLRETQSDEGGDSGTPH